MKWFGGDVHIIIGHHSPKSFLLGKEMWKIKCNLFELLTWKLIRNKSNVFSCTSDWCDVKCNFERASKYILRSTNGSYVEIYWFENNQFCRYSSAFCFGIKVWNLVNMILDECDLRKLYKRCDHCSNVLHVDSLEDHRNSSTCLRK